MGIGFPPFRGGLLFWADQIGMADVSDRLAKLAPLGSRFEPTATIKELAPYQYQVL